MRKILLLSLIALSNAAQAQFFQRYLESRHNLGLFLGGNNYIGDAGRRSFIHPTDVAAGLVYKYHLNYRLIARLNLIAAKLEASDTQRKNAVPLRNDEVRLNGDTHFTEPARYRSVHNKILEGALLLEFNFFRFDPFEIGAHTPYIYAGLGYAFFRQGFIRTETSKVITGLKWRHTIALPFAVGYKYKLDDRLVLGAETGIRYTFTDNLDNSHVTPENQDDPSLRDPHAIRYLKQHHFGNAGDTDWYVFTGITLTYNFGHRPCYCDVDLKRRRKKFLIY